MGVIAVDIDLTEHVELDVVFASSKLFDLGFCARLLGSELVARKAKNA